MKCGDAGTSFVRRALSEDVFSFFLFRWSEVRASEYCRVENMIPPSLLSVMIRLVVFGRLQKDFIMLCEGRGGEIDWMTQPKQAVVD